MEGKNRLYVANSWSLQPSAAGRNTFNPIRAIVDTSTAKPNPDYEPILLAAGDPSLYAGFEPSTVALEAIYDSMESKKFNGYKPSHGTVEGRTAVAEFHSTPTHTLTADDVIMTCGCSGAIDLCIRGLADPGDNVLIPSPGFALYCTILKANGIAYKEYQLLPEENWDVDLEQLDSLFDSRTKAVIVNCPSNPCGSVYTTEHKLEILEVAAKHCVPVIADEVYAGLVYSDVEYESFGAISTSVPVLVCSSISKRYLVPGWRLGWTVLYDPVNALSSEIRKSLVRMCQILNGPCGVVQGALPKILKHTPPKFFRAINKKLGHNAQLVFERLRKVPGLKPIMPRGSMYILVGINCEKLVDFKDDADFTESLFTEMSVRCLPGKAFRAPGFFRIVLCASEEKLIEACNRISEFCSQHCVCH